MSDNVRPVSDRAGRVYTPAVGPRLRPLLWVILVGFALLGANGFYLSSVTALTWWQGSNQQTFFYMLMVVLHLALGFALILPFILFGFGHLVTSWKRTNKSAVRLSMSSFSGWMLSSFGNSCAFGALRYKICDSAK